MSSPPSPTATGSNASAIDPYANVTSQAAGRPRAKMLQLEYKMEAPRLAPLTRNPESGSDVEDVEVLKHATMALFVDIGIGIGGDKWPAADQFCFFMADYRWAPFFDQLFSNKRVIELGSGTGQVGMLVEMLYNPAEVIITDLDVHVPQIEYNITLNPGVSKCKAVEFDWFKPPTDIGKFDVILIFECVYKEELYKPLIESMKILVEQSASTRPDSNGNIFIETPTIFLGLNRLFAKPFFFEQLLSAGFKYKMIPKTSLREQYWDSNSDRDVGLFVVTYDKNIPNSADSSS